MYSIFWPIILEFVGTFLPLQFQDKGFNSQKRLNKTRIKIWISAAQSILSGYTPYPISSKQKKKKEKKNRKKPKRGRKWDGKDKVFFFSKENKTAYVSFHEKKIKEDDGQNFFLAETIDAFFSLLIPSLRQCCFLYLLYRCVWTYICAQTAARCGIHLQGPNNLPLLFPPSTAASAEKVLFIAEGRSKK